MTYTEEWYTKQKLRLSRMGALELQEQLYTHYHKTTIRAILLHYAAQREQTLRSVHIWPKFDKPCPRCGAFIEPEPTRYGAECPNCRYLH